jgi:dipeptidyl aminopeptidase/acylaminoacyl peptidase
MRLSHGLAALLALTVLPMAVLAEGMTLRQIAELRQVGEFSLSPDGRHAAYTVVVPRRLFDEDDGPAWSELHVLDADDGSRGFVTGEVNVSALHWTADGAGITFLAKRGDDETRSLYRIPLSGGEAVRVAGLKTDIRAYALSPDGGSAVLVAQDPESETRKKSTKKGFSQKIYEEDYRDFRLWIVDLQDAGGDPRRIALDGSVQDVLWAPRGNRLAVKLTPAERIDDVLMRTAVVFVDPEQGEITARVDTPGKLGAWAFAPDGAHLALVMARDRNDPREGRLAVVPVTGGTPRELLPELESHVWHVAWRDARRVLYISYEREAARLGEVGRDGRGDRTLAQVDGFIFDGLAVSGNGRSVVLSANTPAHPRELFRLGRGNRPQRVTDHNPWLAGVKLAQQEVVRYQARDGLDLQGVLVHPLQRQPDQRVPLILAVHGGPEAHYSNGWLSSYSLPAQYAAAQGYAMFFPNYRASTGRGVAFSKLNHGRPAQEEFDDLVDGVDHLIEVGLVDRGRVGITGGSYGGYASAWGATYYSERFAAAVAFVALTDKVGMMGTTDIPTELHDVHYLTWPWQDWQLFREASPIYHAHKSKTPTLVLHGEADPRVHVSQGYSLYRYLQLAGQAPVRLVLYPGEGHGNQRAASRWDYSLRLMRWMDHYLMGEGGDPPAYDIDHRQAWDGDVAAADAEETEDG